MKKGDKLFVRIDYRIEGTQLAPHDFDDHIKYLSNIASERYFIGGGFSNKSGGMILFKAENLDKAKKVAENDPLIKRGLYTYELNEWDLVLLSDKL